MGLFDKLVGNGPSVQQGQQTQPTQITPDMVRREIINLQQNPAAYLKQRGFSLPANINASDPRQITQYLLQSGQIGSGRLQQILRGLGAIK